MISIHFHKYCCICLWHLTQNFSSWFYRRIRKGHIERRFSSLILQAVTAAEPLFRTSLVTDIAVLPVAESWWGDQVWPPLTKYLGLLPTDSEGSLLTNTSLLSLAVRLALPSRELACHRQRQPGGPHCLRRPESPPTQRHDDDGSGACARCSSRDHTVLGTSCACKAASAAPGAQTLGEGTWALRAGEFVVSWDVQSIHSWQNWIVL